MTNATVNIRVKLKLIHEHWSPKLVGQVNDTDIKLVKLQGEFVWHHHEREDELFFVLQGRLCMQFRDREEWVEPNEFIMVPHGVEHRPVAPEKCTSCSSSHAARSTPATS
jgi:mannose-6-phosphate isomerase-like protein (cupin superfamily)